MTLAREHGKQPTGQSTEPSIESSITINFDGVQLTGYVLSDDSFQFLIGRQMRQFDSLREVRTAWEAHLKGSGGTSRQ